MLRIIVYVLWIAAVLLQLAVAQRIMRHKVFREYPLFFAYVSEQILSFPTLFCAYHYGSQASYRHLYMGWGLLDVVLKFGMIAELFAHVFSSYKSIRKWGSRAVRIASVALVLTSTGIAGLSNLADRKNFVSKFFAMERSAEIVQGGLLFLLFCLCYALALQWKQPSLGIAFGLCVITALNLTLFTLRTEFGSDHDQLFSLISNFGYDVSVILWLLTLYQRPPRIDAAGGLSAAAPLDVASWNRTLTEVIRR